MRNSILPEPDEVDILHLMGFERSSIRAIKQSAGERLLPVQRKALEAGLFEGRNLVVMSPTASGKGLVGELACLREAEGNRRSIFLVPTRALATEKHRHLCEAYGSLGVRVRVSSSDHREFDQAILRGEYHIAVVVYEKLRSLLIQRPDLLDEVGVVVVDELQNLFDEERGGGLEFLLTFIRSRPVQIIGLSAALGNHEVTDWLGADLVLETERPVELRQGVLFDGVFRYREYNSQEEGEEGFVGVDESAEQGILCQTVLYLAERRGESVLVFAATREETFALASRMAEMSALTPADGALQELAVLEPTATVEFLRRTLGRGIAVHNGDLTLEERRVVERGVRDGEVCVVCATTTLSEGVNLPVVNTFVPRRVYRGPRRAYEGYGRGPDAVPLSRCEFQNMTGRSGRPGSSGHPPFGRGIMLAFSRAEANALLRDYVEGPIERLPFRQFDEGLDCFLLEMLAREGGSTESAMESFFAGALSAMARPREDVSREVKQGLQRLCHGGLVSRKNGKYEADGWGQLVGLHGLRVGTGLFFADFLRECDPATASALDLLLIAGLAPESGWVRIPVSHAEWKKGRLEREFLRLVDEGEINPWVAGKAGYAPAQGSVGIAYGSGMALKKALLLQGYASGVPTPEVEATFRVRLGLIQRVAEGAAWLLRALADLAHFGGWPTEDQDRILDLAETVKCGLPREALGLVPLMESGLSRTYVLALAEAGLGTVEKVREAGEENLASVIPASHLRFLVQWRQTREEESREEKRAVSGGSQAEKLVVDSGRPDRMMYSGVEVPLTKTQFRLMEILYRNRGRCVSYDEIMRYVWEGTIVEQNNVIDQKGRILKKLDALVGKQSKPLVRTIRGHGLLLEEE